MENLREQTQAYLTYQKNVRRASENTIQSYERDLRRFCEMMEKQGVNDPSRVTPWSLSEYLDHLNSGEFKATTVSRNLAALKGLFHFMARRGVIHEDITTMLKPPKIEKKLPVILSQEEIAALLAQTDGNSKKAIRDKAMLELMCSTGLRVSELIELKISDVNVTMGYVVCREKSGDRMISFGEEANAALRRYLGDTREDMIGEPTDLLFVNVSGSSMSRQGFWKLIKSYAKKAGIKKDITPHTFRHTFAAKQMQEGAGLKELQETLGHSDISSTQVYRKVKEEQDAELAAKRAADREAWLKLVEENANADL